MTQQTQAVAIQQPKAVVTVGSRGIQINDIEGLYRFATAVSKSGLAPKGIESPEAILVAVQMGLEVGLTPMAALQNIAVINGRPSVWGDAQLAIVRATGELEEFEEWYETGGKKLLRNPLTFDDSTTAVCRLKRTGYPPTEFGFSVGDAKKAGLWSKAGPWSQYPARMLRFRARSFTLRDNFGDALKGLLTREEAEDISPEARFAAAKTVSQNTSLLPEPTRDEALEAINAQAAKPEPEPVAMPAPEPEQAPAEPVRTNKPLTPHAQLRQVLAENEITPDSFLSWAIEGGYALDSVVNIDEMPEAKLKVLLKNKAGMVAEIKGGGK